MRMPRISMPRLSFARGGIPRAPSGGERGGAAPAAVEQRPPTPAETPPVESAAQEEQARRNREAAERLSRQAPDAALETLAQQAGTSQQTLEQQTVSPEPEGAKAAAELQSLGIPVGTDTTVDSLMPRLQERGWQNDEATRIHVEKGIKLVQEQEAKKVYENPLEDPALANAQDWDVFVTTYPEKASAYADKNQDVRAALQRQARQQEQPQAENTQQVSTETRELSTERAETMAFLVQHPEVLDALGKIVKGGPEMVRKMLDEMENTLSDEEKKTSPLLYLLAALLGAMYIGSKATEMAVEQERR